MKTFETEKYNIPEGAVKPIPKIPTETPEEKESLDEKTYRYEKVTDSIFELKEEFERGELLYLDVDDKHYSIETEKQLVNCFDSDCVYRRIEVTERELFIEESCKIVGASIDSDAANDFGKQFDSGKFKLVKGE